MSSDPETTHLSRAASMPAWVRDVGGMTRLTASVAARAVRPPFSWLPEFVTQFRFVLGAAFLPLMVSAFAVSFGPVGVQASGLFEIFGSLDRMGAIYEITVVRYIGPIIVGIILAGTAGTAICADLGARVVRDEISALQVMGVDPLRSLIVPRVLAMALTAVLFTVAVIVAGFVGALAVMVQHDAEVGPFLHVFLSSGTAADLPFAIFKAGLYGAVIAVVSAHRGMNVSGGPEGVGRAVNQTVVIAFLAIGFLDYACGQFILATHPEMSQVRG